jgi:hypothetical protein
MPSQLLEQLSHGPVVRNRIRHGHDALEPKHAALVARHNGAPIGVGAAIGILHVVFAVGVCFPDVDLGARHGVAGRSFQRADDEQRRARGVCGDAGPRG